MWRGCVVGGAEGLFRETQVVRVWRSARAIGLVGWRAGVFARWLFEIAAAYGELEGSYGVGMAVDSVAA